MEGDSQASCQPLLSPSPPPPPQQQQQPPVQQTYNVAPTAASQAAAQEAEQEMNVYDGPMLRQARAVKSNGREIGDDDSDDGTQPFATGTMTVNGKSTPIKLNKNAFKNLIWFILCPCLLLCPSVCDDDDTDNWRMNPITPKRGEPLLACRLLCCPCLEPKPQTTTHFPGHTYQYENAMMASTMA